MSNLKLSKLYRYNVKDPANPLLNISYKIDCWEERNKEYLTLNGEPGLKELEFNNNSFVLEPNVTYIAYCVGNCSELEPDVGVDYTLPNYKILGVDVHNYKPLSPGSNSAEFTIRTQQYLKVSKGDLIYES